MTINFFIPYRDCDADQKELIHLVKRISGDFWSAGWLDNIERIAWDTYVAGEGPYFDKELTAADGFQDLSEQLTMLHKKTRGWVAYEEGIDGSGEGFVSLPTVLEAP